MKDTKISEILHRLLFVAAVLGAAVPFASCDRLHENLEECKIGARIRFIYDYNMEFANAFMSQVDCLTVLFYDESGRYVTTRTNATDDLKDENWRMELELAPGKYTILAYGGMDCSRSSFSFVSSPATVSLTNVEVELNADCLTNPDLRELHDLFYGRAEVTVEATDTEYREVTVEMMKDTNNLRIMLQQVDGSAIDVDDFDFKIIDDNTLMGWDNEVIPTVNVDYLPWTEGNAFPGELPDEGGVASVAWAEISFPRLVMENNPRLIVARSEDDSEVVNIPLVNYLLLMKSEKYSRMDDQEFLDRESRWEMLFFLQGNIWLKTVIVVNDWIVRINDITGM